MNGTKFRPTRAELGYQAACGTAPNSGKQRKHVPEPLLVAEGEIEFVKDRAGIC